MSRTGMTKEEREKKKNGRLVKRENKANTGTHFMADEPHVIFSSPSVYRKRINEYFDICTKNRKPQTLPGLCLYLGLRTKTLTNYEPPIDAQDYKNLTDYALQRIESFAAEHFFLSKGSTKGVEFLLQNTIGWANKSDVNSKQTVELTEKEKLKQMPEDALRERVKTMIPKLSNVVGFPTPTE